MSTYGLKVANTRENNLILNRKESGWWINYEDEELLEIEFETEKECNEMHNLLIKLSTRPWAHRS